MHDNIIDSLLRNDLDWSHPANFFHSSSH